MEAIGFRALERADYALLSGWLAEPAVRRWWNHDPGLEAVERDFGPSIDGADRADVCIALADGRPFGLIQRYPIADTQEYVDELSAVLPVPPHALSVDYLIGEPAYRGRGLGARMIAAFIDQAWSAFPEAMDVIVPVSAANEASWRALERAGLRRVAEGELEPDNPIDDRDHVIYWTGRPASSPVTLPG